MEPTPRTLDPIALEATDSFLTQFAFAWRRKGLVLFALALALAVGYVLFLRSDPVYQSKAQVLIVEDRANIPIEAIENRMTSEEMHIEVMRSQKVLRKAAEKLNEGKEIAKIRGGPISEGEIMGSLTVIGAETYSQTGVILRLTYQSIYAEECPLVLAAVVDAYRWFVDETHNKTSDDTVEQVNNAKNQLENELDELVNSYREFRLNSPLVVTGATAQNIHDTRLKLIEEVRSQTSVENMRMQAKIDSISAALARGSTREALNLIVGHVDAQDVQSTVSMPAELARLRTTHLFPMLIERQMLVERYGADYPKIAEVNRQIQVTEKYIADLIAAEELAQPTTEELENPRDYYEVYLESLREQIQINDSTIAKLSEEYETERAAAKELMNYYVEDEMFRAEIDRKRGLFEPLRKRFEELNLIKDRHSTEIQLIHEPALGTQVKPNFTFMMIASTAIGLFSGMGLAYLVDLSDQRFRSPDDIRAELGVPVVGNIPLISSIPRSERRRIAAEHAMQAELRAVFEPRGRIAEAYRAVRTALYFSTRSGGHKVIQVTSPNPSDGKSTLAGNLAVTVAHSGKRVLLVDADFRRPRCHKLFGIDNSVGVTGVIDGSAELPDAIQATEVENLSLLPCGRRPKNPAEILTSRQFAELLDTLREQSDLIIVDSPPVLAVTDPLNVAPRVDGVLLVMRLTKIARAAGLQTLEALEEVGANVLGVVVNGVGAGQSYNGYGYGKGKYYGGRYGNPYGYRDKSASSYYQEDPEDPVEHAEEPTMSNGKH